ncbi:GNAT family N-acetyltransferase [Cryobacterium sp. PH31-O1]|uniref:GNAT family N-acetyltransferase n=1 Tax=Cryobacterium sp. PH31-O1 TaxID=3046306 RepID=UPI0024BA1E9C|nr:GNAT family N-acetyltransferase [Cryobacterium sp. PH31-O1]MDJ0338333.1 GNAT family N-acetyltransferase [Cryobacterium sp. PH31-O1]
MSGFLILSALESADAAALADFHRVAAAALAFDGYAPFNEQALYDLQSGLRTAYLVLTEEIVVGAALGGRGEIDLVISPEFRRRGYGREAFRELAATEPNGLTAWSHGDHPAARALATELRFVAARTLLELRKPLVAAGEAMIGAGDGIETAAGTAQTTTGTTPTGTAAGASALAGGETISAFRVGIDDAEWVALNALVFATHPEQGAITAADLTARQAESWFNADDFLLLRDAAGRLIGYNWLKVEGTIGEIYVVGVHADAAGRGLGRALMQAGLQRLVAAGCTGAALYVEADSLGPVHLYRNLGFADHTVDVQYRRL